MVTCRVGPLASQVAVQRASWDPGRAVFVCSSVASVLVPTMFRRCLRVEELRKSRGCEGELQGGPSVWCWDFVLLT